MKHHASTHIHTVGSHDTFLSRLRANLLKEISAFGFLAKETLIIIVVGVLATFSYIFTFTKALLTEFGFIVASVPKTFFDNSVYFFEVVVAVIVFVAYVTII